MYVLFSCYRHRLAQIRVFSFEAHICPAIVRPLSNLKSSMPSNEGMAVIGLPLEVFAFAAGDNLE
jgi:hypothetical protein